MSTNTLASGATLTANQALVSNNGVYTLKVGTNGIVFLDNLQTGQRLWVQGKLLQVSPVLTMQTSGNLVFTEGNPTTTQWQSGTVGYPSAYDANGDPIWSTGTAQGDAVAAPAALVEMRAAFENALTKLSVVERAFAERAAAGGPGNQAAVNVHGYTANAE
jgi:outer membrane protein assembly factor BamB